MYVFEKNAWPAGFLRISMEVKESAQDFQVEVRRILVLGLRAVRFPW